MNKTRKYLLVVVGIVMLMAVAVLACVTKNDVFAETTKIEKNGTRFLKKIVNGYSIIDCGRVL